MSDDAQLNSDAFILLCSEKSTRDAGDHKLEDAFQSLSLKCHVESLQEHVPNSKVAYLPGAGALYQVGCVHAIVEGRWLCIFSGCVTADALMPQALGHALHRCKFQGTSLLCVYLIPNKQL
jgi:hypothetical protein